MRKEDTPTTVVRGNMVQTTITRSAGSLRYNGNPPQTLSLQIRIGGLYQTEPRGARSVDIQS